MRHGHGDREVNAGAAMLLGRGLDKLGMPFLSSKVRLLDTALCRLASFPWPSTRC